MESGTEHGAAAGPPRGDRAEQTPGHIFLDFLGVVTKWRTFIVRFVLVGTLGAILFALFSPNWYKATAVVFPAEQADMSGGIEGVSSLMKTFGAGGRLGGLGGASETERYLAILGSENALLKVIEKFDLTAVYDITKYPREKTIKELRSNMEISEGDGETLEVSVYDRDPARAMEMANYFLEVLNDINSGLHSQNARGNRVFIEQRYEQSLLDVRRAEDSLHQFQMKNGLIALPEQLEATIKAGTEIYGRIASKEIELDIMRRTLSESHPEIIEAEMELEAMKNKLTDFNTGAGSTPGEMKILVPLGKAPELGLEYIRLYRNTEIHYKILQFITPLYEQAKVEEQRNTPSVVVLDRAALPERKAKPKISIYGLLGLVVSSLLALFGVLIAESVGRIRSIDPGRWDGLWTQIREDWFGLKKKRKGA